MVLLLVRNSREVIAQSKIERQFRKYLPIVHNVGRPALEVQMHGVTRLDVRYRTRLWRLRCEGRAEQQIRDLIVRERAVEAINSQWIDGALPIQHDVAPIKTESQRVLSVCVRDRIGKVPCRLQATRRQVGRPSYAAQSLCRASVCGQAEPRAESYHGVIRCGHLERVCV